MSSQSLMLVGFPDSGKTNYLACLWAALRRGGGKLIAPNIPNDIKYVEEALEHIHQGKFAPRSNKELVETPKDFSVSAVLAGGNPSHAIDIIVPDVSGELWKSTVEDLELSVEWMSRLNEASGALIFVRVLSSLNVVPLNWVTSNKLMKMQKSDPLESDKIPTQVVLCELLRFLELTLKPLDNGSLPRVAILVTAWDRLDQETSAAGPNAFLTKEYPLFSGRLKGVEKLNTCVFGVSAIGGDLQDDSVFQEKFHQTGLKDTGYIVKDTQEGVIIEYDLTSPIAWLVES